jgi:tricorn protease
MQAGYYRYPTVHDDKIVFVAEDDLWVVPAEGGVARRLTSGLGEASRPAFSPDGAWLAFTSREEGAEEVYVMPAAGGRARRLTYLSGPTSSAAWTAGWTAGGDVIFASDAGQPFGSQLALHVMGLDSPQPERMPYGPAQTISFGPNGGVVIGRNIAFPARWKRYRGGRAGQIWIDKDGGGEFTRLIDLEATPSTPF